MTAARKKWKRALGITAAILAGVVALWLFLQFVWPHRTQPFHPDYPQADLAPILARDTLSPADYETLFAQTGLGPAAIDELLARGEEGLQQILETQEGFFDPPGSAPCSSLGITTREHRFLNGEGYLVYAVPLAPLREGDVLVSLSTHTAGWNHGHAGLVVCPDPVRPVTLESVVLGSLSAQMDTNHWRSYTTLAVLRPKAEEAARQQVVDLALERLDGIPYSLLCGIFGEKFQPLEGSHSAHCSYLPWYAWRAVGLDLDGDGGRIVTPNDLLHSDKVEVVQIYGLDPAQFSLELPG